MNDWINLMGAKEQISDLLTRLEKEYKTTESEIPDIKRRAGML